MENERKKAALYLRLSEEDRDKQDPAEDSRSIQNQRSMLVSYAARQGWDIYDIYSDDDYTGADRRRPEFNRLIRDAEARKFDIVLCKSQSRFTREMELTEKYLHTRFPQWGIRFVGIVDHADTDNAGNKKARQINGLVNEWYLEDLSESIKGVLTDKRIKGYHIGAFAAYGYLKDPEQKGHLIPDPEAAEVVRRIFELFAAGTGKLAIARRLNQEGIPNPTAYKLEKGIRKKAANGVRGKSWSYYTVSDILSNEMYIGNMIQGKYGSISYKTHINRPRPKESWYRKEGTHQPIIEKELWDKVQDIRKSRARAAWDGQLGLFAGKARCMYCGYVMRSQKHNVHGRRYLRCGTRLVTGPEACRGGFIGVEELEQNVLENLRMITAQYLDVEAAQRQLQLQDDREKEKNRLERSASSLRTKIDSAEKSLKTLYRDRSDGIITIDEYYRLSKGFRDDLQGYETQLEEMKSKLHSLQSEQDMTVNKRELLIRFADIKQLDNAIVNTLIDYIEVGRREGHYTTAKAPVVIHWRF